METNRSITDHARKHQKTTNAEGSGFVSFFVAVIQTNQKFRRKGKRTLLKNWSKQPGTEVAAMHCLQISMYHNRILRVQINDSFRQLETPQFKCKRHTPARNRERERERERERDRDRQRQAGRQTKTKQDKPRQTETNRNKPKHNTTKSQQNRQKQQTNKEARTKHTHTQLLLASYLYNNSAANYIFISIIFSVAI